MFLKSEEGPSSLGQNHRALAGHVTEGPQAVVLVSVRPRVDAVAVHGAVLEMALIRLARGRDDEHAFPV